MTFSYWYLTVYIVAHLLDQPPRQTIPFSNLILNPKRFLFFFFLVGITKYFRIFVHQSISLNNLSCHNLVFFPILYLAFHIFIESPPTFFLHIPSLDIPTTMTHLTYQTSFLNFSMNHI